MRAVCYKLISKARQAGGSLSSRDDAASRCREYTSMCVFPDGCLLASCWDLGLTVECCSIFQLLTD